MVPLQRGKTPSAAAGAANRPFLAEKRATNVAPLR
jgi:hypothetical protein